MGNVSPELAKAIRHEAVDRGLTIGELIEEAFAHRVILTRTTRTEEDL